MKKNMIYLCIVIVAVFILSGCKAEDEQSFYIPSPVVTQEPSKEQTKPSEKAEEPTGEADEEPSDKPVHVGKTTTQYVKLDDYDAILNIRSAPSREGEIVGFLVHTEQVEVISIEDGWASFVYQDEIRYVSADFLVDKKPAYIAPPTPTTEPTPTKEPDPNEAPPEI